MVYKQVLSCHKVAGKVFGKRRIDKERRRLWRKMGKLRKRLATTKSISRAASLHLSLQKVEHELKLSYEKQGWEQESKIVNSMKVDPRAFFAYGRARQKNQS